MVGKTQHFATLDALRGVAAIAVVLGHLGKYQAFGILPKSYLAVDFFFMLSGFVIARAYEEPLRNGGTMIFIKKRIIRLYPLIVLAMVFGLVTELSKTVVLHSGSAIPLAVLPAEFLCGVLLLPYLAGRGWGNIFPFNPPLWSLFFEAVINGLYAFGVRFLNTSRLVFLLVVAGICLIGADIYVGNLNFGWSRFYVAVGLARVMFAFPMGILLYRLYSRGWFDHIPQPSGLWLAMYLVILFMPGETFLGRWYDPVCVLVLFPVIVMAGCFDRLPVTLVPVAGLLGRLSYPVYVLHWPTVYRNGYHLIAKTHGAMLAVACVFDVAAICFMAWAAAKFFDEPVRRYLTGRFIAKAPGRGGGGLEGDAQAGGALLRVPVAGDEAVIVEVEGQVVFGG